MANSFFAFKKFVIRQERCAMKVGTDGVLLGAWADVAHARRILDVGTGTGLVALMMAQRCKAEIEGLEIDGSAAAQACENVSASPWADRVRIRQGDFRVFEWKKRFDLIVSNPPYFKNSLLSPDDQRNKARHDNELSFYDLITRSAVLLESGGCLSLIVPASLEDEVVRVALSCKLFPIKKTYIRTTPSAGPKRLLIAFGFSEQACATGTITVELSRHVYSAEYKMLTADYYLNG